MRQKAKSLSAQRSLPRVRGEVGLHATEAAWEREGAAKEALALRKVWSLPVILLLMLLVLLMLVLLRLLLLVLLLLLLLVLSEHRLLLVDVIGHGLGLG